ncbi:hypothetical protein ACFOTA_17750 [Chitinophaga sp. GCM10012297]|uniref:Uncharacterized protein n=1 Tax=Chitinophaga chungangae TaxID=2821488 RepID=A0ABS3YH96_9BACT|nr:hypothetical protein [Chitinophaga chungangae]MBO9154068.1 hypothetical protein [Chitinophaga chungangae]
MKYWLISLALLIAVVSGIVGYRKHKAAGIMKDPGNKLMQVQEINGYTYRFMYLPKGTPREWCFRINVHVPPDPGNNAPESNQASYGIDTLFHIVSGADTLLPAKALRIANGNLNGVEYMVCFAQRKLKDGDAIFEFKDRLFNNRYVSFSVNFSAIQKIDPLSKSL